MNVNMSRPSQTSLTSLEIGNIVHTILIAPLPSDRDTSVHYENQYYPDFLFYWLALWACWLYAEQVQLLFVKCLCMYVLLVPQID